MCQPISRTSDFKDVYLYAYKQGLKGCTTFRFNPEAFQGVLVKEKDLKNTVYTFELADGTTVDLKGDEEIEYDGEVHTAANLFRCIERRLLRQVLSRIRKSSKMIKIDKKIVGYAVAQPEPQEATEET